MEGKVRTGECVALGPAATGMGVRVFSGELGKVVKVGARLSSVAGGSVSEGKGRVGKARVGGGWRDCVNWHASEPSRTMLRRENRLKGARRFCTGEP